MERSVITIEKAVEGMDTGKIFTAFFLKRTADTMRSMNARTGVKKGVTGKGMSYKPSDRGLKVVYDMSKKDFRTINLRGLIGVRIAGATHLVRPEGILL